MLIEQTKNFKKITKKLHASNKKYLDDAILTIKNEPKSGELKVGDLTGIRVYKFDINKQQQLLAYQYFEDSKKIVLIALGSHENFYRNLEKTLK